MNKKSLGILIVFLIIATIAVVFGLKKSDLMPAPLGHLRPQTKGYDAGILSSELSAIEEVIYHFDQNSNIPAYAFHEKAGIHWNNGDGYTIVIPADKSFFIAKSDKGCLDRNIVPSIFKDELFISEEVFKKRGFDLDENNSSYDILDDRLYDYTQTYKKGDEVCTIIVNPDCSSYAGSGLTVAHTLSVSCGIYSQKLQDEQMPFLKALDLKDKDATVRIIKQRGDFFEVGFGFQRTGSVAVLKREGGSYRVLFIGQEAPSCELIEKESIPSEVLSSIGGGGCFAENGEYIPEKVINKQN